MVDSAHTGRKPSACGDASTALVKSAVEEDRRKTCVEISKEVSVPQATVYRVLTKKLGKKRVFAILRERCYDDPGNPQDAWSHHVRFSKSALTADNMAKRRRWGEQELAAGHREEWYFKNLVWTDICNSILARAEQRQQMMTLARKGTKGWMSADSKAESKNLLGKKTARSALRGVWLCLPSCFQNLWAS